jgi:predicted RNA-binding Zn-ribbon protein involved in translation (DUF1610 family)
MSASRKDSRYDYTIALDSADLEIGGSTKEFLCPRCGGGDTKEKAFNLTRVATGILYKCHRGKCGFAGFVPTMLSSLQTTPTRRKIRPYTGETVLLWAKYRAMFWEKYGLTRPEIAAFRMDLDSGRIVQPWHAANGYVAGHILRAYDGQKPKSLTFWDNDGVPILDYYGVDRRHLTQPEIWLVEDQLSAIKLSRYVPSAALIGCHISEAQAADIRKNFRYVFLALDNDATVKAINLSMKYKLYFRNFWVVPLSKDVKDMPDEQIKELLGGYFGSENLRGVAART